MGTKCEQAVEKEREKFCGLLKQKGLRLTPGRDKVFETIIQTHGHFTAEELVKSCTRRRIGVSRATIYRSLHELLEAGVIRETAFGDKHNHYEHVYDEKPHHHAKCIKCGSFTEFPDLHEDDIYRPLLEKMGFQILGHEMHFYGICKQCQ